MQGVIVEFQFADDFDESTIAGIAHEARGFFSDELVDNSREDA